MPKAPKLARATSPIPAPFISRLSLTDPSFSRTLLRMAAFSFLRTLLILGRTSNLPTVWTNVLVGWFLSGGAWTAELAWIVLGISLIYLAGMTLNDAFDAAWDRVHATSRPIPAGRISTGAVWITGAIEMIAGAAIILCHSTLHPTLLLALLLAILLYNWLHKRWAGSVLIMGLCRALVYLGAGSAVASQTNSIELPTSLFVLAGGVILYIAGLTLAARKEHLATPASLPLIPRLMLALPILFPFIAGRSSPSDLLKLTLVILGVIAIQAWIMIVRRALVERIPKGIAYAIAGIALYDAAAVAFADWRASLLALVLFALTLSLQRVIPAT